MREGEEGEGEEVSSPRGLILPDKLGPQRLRQVQDVVICRPREPFVVVAAVKLEYPKDGRTRFYGYPVLGSWLPEQVEVILDITTTLTGL